MSAIKFRWVYLLMTILALSAIYIYFLNIDSFDVTGVLLSCMFLFPLFVAVNRRVITFCEARCHLDPPIRGSWEDLICLYFDKELVLGSVFSVALFIVFFVLQDLKELTHTLCLVFAISFIVALVDMLLFGFDDFEENEHLKDNQSIGACWAIGAFQSYYEIVFDDIVERMSVFEKEHDIKFCTKKFILLAPMSCNVRKTLDRDGESNIEVFGELKDLEHDQGANINRKLKNTVYKITEDLDEFYIVAGFPSSLNTLWDLRETVEAGEKIPIGRMNNLQWEYHRDCFIKNLEPLVKDYPCIFLKYDDKNTEKSLSAFLKSELSKRGFLKKMK